MENNIEPREDDILIGSNEYKARYIGQLVKRGLDTESAGHDYSARVSSFDKDEFGDPEFDADEALTYYTD